MDWLGDPVKVRHRNEPDFLVIAATCAAAPVVENFPAPQMIASSSGVFATGITLPGTGLNVSLAL